jgi:hypothetical protein
MIILTAVIFPLPASSTKPRTISPSTVRGLQFANTPESAHSAASIPSRRCERIDLRADTCSVASKFPFGGSRPVECPFVIGSSRLKTFSVVL